MTTQTQREQALAHSQYLWAEYRYRHDLIWQRTFTFTTAITLIAILPYVQKEVVLVLDNWILIAPLLGVCLSVFGLFVILNELHIFSKIKCVYRGYQNALYEHLHPNYEHKKIKCAEESIFYWLKNSSFNQFVTSYFFSLLVLSAANCFIVWLVWIPGIREAAAGLNIWLL